MVLLDVEAAERATLALDDDDERLVNGTLVDGVADVDCRAKIGFVQRVSRLLDDHERYEPDELEPDEAWRCGGHASGTGFPGTAGAVNAGLPCGTQAWRGGVTA